VVLPKVKGLHVVEGSIEDPKVVNSIMTYHPIAANWIQAHLRLLSTPNSPITKEQLSLLGDNLLRDSDSLIPITLSHRPHLNLLLSSDTDSASLRAYVTTMLKEKPSLQNHLIHPLNLNPSFSLSFLNTNSTWKLQTLNTKTKSSLQVNPSTQSTNTPLTFEDFFYLVSTTTGTFTFPLSPIPSLTDTANQLQ